MLLRRLAQVAEPLTAFARYRIRHGLARGMRRQGGLGFLASECELSAEEQFLEGLELTGQTIYDVGGFEGLYTLFFARKTGITGRVVTFEPIPGSLARIHANLRLNNLASRVQVEPVALGRAERRVNFCVPGGYRGIATGDPDIKAAQAAGMEYEAPCKPLDAYLGLLPPPDFIKIDVEGMEVDVIRGAIRTLERHRPALFIETHGRTRETATTFALLPLLESLGYHTIHAETGAAITVDTVPASGSVHLYSRT